LNIAEIMEGRCDKNEVHSYGPVYEQLFGPIRANVKNFLEIGIFLGQSMKVWRDYFSNAEIHGLDIDWRHVVRVRGWDRITGHICDQSKPGDLYTVASAICDEKEAFFDIIIDDGSHDPQHQIISFFTLRPFLKPGGYYIIEDVQDPEDAGFFTR
jgi:hypothetical protein